MKKIILIILFFTIAAGSGGLAQDNIYGDYLLFSADKKVSLDLEDAQLLDVLKMLSQQTKLNFISTEAIRQRRLTLYIEDMPLKEALDIIFEANNLAYNYYPDANAFVIKEMGKPSLELKTKIYTLKYARIYFSKLNKEIISMLEAKGGAEGEDEEEASTELERPGDPIIIMDAVEAVLSEYGRVTADPLTNSLIVVDVPSQFPMIDELISKLDVAVPKVMIEVEMLDVSKTSLDELGFDWSNDSLGLTGTYTPIPNAFLPFNTRTNRLLKTGTLDFSSLTSVIKFLKEQTTTKFLGRPKIVTLANETAEVSLTSLEVVGLDVIVNDNVTTTQPRTETTGTRLRVTPQVDMGSRNITLAVDVFNRDTVDSGLGSSNLTGGNFQNVDERSTKNIVRLKDGDTLFIGGLLSNNKSTTESKIPFLGDIPLLGSLFRYKQKPSSGNIDRELLVFITPRIIEETFTSYDKKAAALKREQVDYSKKDAMKVALDSFMR